MEKVYNGREESMNILSYVNCAKLCNGIKKFPKLNRNFVKEAITFPNFSSSRSI